MFLGQAKLRNAYVVFLVVLPMLLPERDPYICRIKFVAGRMLRSPAKQKRGRQTVCLPLWYVTSFRDEVKNGWSYIATYLRTFTSVTGTSLPF
jgi:hypothetical protein